MRTFYICFILHLLSTGGILPRSGKLYTPEDLDWSDPFLNDIEELVGEPFFDPYSEKESSSSDDVEEAVGDLEITMDEQTSHIMDKDDPIEYAVGDFLPTKETHSEQAEFENEDPEEVELALAVEDSQELEDPVGSTPELDEFAKLFFDSEEPLGDALYSEENWDDSLDESDEESVDNWDESSEEDGLFDSDSDESSEDSVGSDDTFSDHELDYLEDVLKQMDDSLDSEDEVGEYSDSEEYSEEDSSDFLDSQEEEVGDFIETPVGDFVDDSADYSDEDLSRAEEMVGDFLSEEYDSSDLLPNSGNFEDSSDEGFDSEAEELVGSGVPDTLFQRSAMQSDEDGLDSEEYAVGETPDYIHESEDSSSQDDSVESLDSSDSDFLETELVGDSLSDEEDSDEVAVGDAYDFVDELFDEEPVGELDANGWAILDAPPYKKARNYESRHRQRRDADGWDRSEREHTVSEDEEGDYDDLSSGERRYRRRRRREGARRGKLQREFRPRHRRRREHISTVEDSVGDLDNYLEVAVGDTQQMLDDIDNRLSSLDFLTEEDVNDLRRRLGENESESESDDTFGPDITLEDHLHAIKNLHEVANRLMQLKHDHEMKALKESKGSPETSEKTTTSPAMAGHGDPQLISHSHHIAYGADKGMKSLLMQMQGQVDPVHKELHDFIMNDDNNAPKLVDRNQKDDQSLKDQLEEFKKKLEGNARVNAELRAKLLALKNVERVKDEEMRKKEEEERKRLENEKKKAEEEKQRKINELEAKKAEARKKIEEMKEQIRKKKDIKLKEARNKLVEELRHQLKELKEKAEQRKEMREKRREERKKKAEKDKEEKRKEAEKEEKERQMRAEAEKRKKQREMEKRQKQKELDKKKKEREMEKIQQEKKQAELMEQKKKLLIERVKQDREKRMEKAKDAIAGEESRQRLSDKRLRDLYRTKGPDFHLQRISKMFPFITHFFGHTGDMKEPCGEAQCRCGFHTLSWKYKNHCYMVEGMCQECDSPDSEKVKAIGFTYRYVEEVKKRLPIFTYRRRGAQWVHEPKEKSVCPTGKIVTGIRTMVTKTQDAHKHSMKIKCGPGKSKGEGKSKEGLKEYAKQIQNKQMQKEQEYTKDEEDSQKAADEKDDPTKCLSKGKACECGFISVTFTQAANDCFIPGGECNRCGSNNIEAAIQAVGFDYVYNDERKKEFPKFVVRKKGEEWKEPKKQFQCKAGYVVNGVWTSAEKDVFGPEQNGKKPKRDQYYLSITCRKSTYTDAEKQVTTTTLSADQEEEEDPENSNEGDNNSEASEESGPVKQHECPPAVSECKCGFSFVAWRKLQDCYQLQGDCLECGTPGAVNAIGYNYKFDKERKKSIYRWRYRTDGKLWSQPERRYSCSQGKMVTNIATSAVRSGDEVKYHLWMKCNDVIPTTPKVALNGMVSWFKYGGWDGKTWRSQVGNSTMEVFGGKIETKTERGNGAESGIWQVQGTAATQVGFGQIIERDYTICTLSRYTGVENQRRILIGSSGNWLHGHWSGQAGVAIYGEWMTRSINRIEPNTNWLFMCGQNAQRSIIRANGKSIKKANGGIKGPMKLQINKGGCCEKEASNWAVAEIMTWNRFLTFAELLHVEAYLTQILKKGNLDQKPSTTQAASSTSSAALAPPPPPATSQKAQEAVASVSTTKRALSADNAPKPKPMFDFPKLNVLGFEKSPKINLDMDDDIQQAVSETFDNIHVAHKKFDDAEVPLASADSEPNTRHSRTAGQRTEENLMRAQLGLAKVGGLLNFNVVILALFVFGVVAITASCYYFSKEHGDSVDAYYDSLANELHALE